MGKSKPEESKRPGRFAVDLLSQWRLLPGSQLDTIPGNCDRKRLERSDANRAIPKFGSIARWNANRLRGLSCEQTPQSVEQNVQKQRESHSLTNSDPTPAHGQQPDAHALSICTGLQSACQYLSTAPAASLPPMAHVLLYRCSRRNARHRLMHSREQSDDLG